MYRVEGLGSRAILDSGSRIAVYVIQGMELD